MAVAEIRHIHLNAAFLSGSGQKKEIVSKITVQPHFSSESPGLYGKKAGAFHSSL